MKRFGIKMVDCEKTAILACRTIKDELEFAQKQENKEHDIYWVESNLHNWPDKLRDNIQQELDKLDSYERILLGFCVCGNSVLGIQTRNFELIMPKTDDCISLMLGSMKRKMELTSGHHSLFLTKGWMKHEANIWGEYEHTLKKYGAEITADIMNTIYGKYDWLSIIDTGAYVLDDILPETQKIADAFDFEHIILEGSTSYIEQLLTGPWDSERFIRVPPRSIITDSMLIIKK